jgi:hypothetical protein
LSFSRFLIVKPSYTGRVNSVPSIRYKSRKSGLEPAYASNRFSLEGDALLELARLHVMTAGHVALFHRTIPCFATPVQSTARRQQEKYTFKCLRILTLLVSVWELGEAFGPLFIGPLSKNYGRLRIYHTTRVIFIIFSLACAVSSDIDMLLVFRFLNGMGALRLLVFEFKCRWRNVYPRRARRRSGID